MTAPRYSPAVLEALARWDEARRLCNSGLATWEDMTIHESRLCAALDAFREQSMQRAEAAALDEATRDPQPHRHSCGGPL